MSPANYYPNSSAPPFTQLDQPSDHHHQFLNPNPQSVAASSSSLPCHIFFSSTQDQNGYYRGEMQQHHHQQEADNFVSYGESSDLEEDQRKNGLKISLWNKKDQNETYSKSNPVKWMSSKIRLTQKMKKPDQTTGGEIQANTTFKFEDLNQKQPSSSSSSSLSSPLETHHKRSSSSFSTSSNINPIRVCSDCNTTKTPLWRSGPKGPKSLCNACGIRQRKARRAMAVAAAAANGTVPASETTTTTIMNNKVQQKEKTRNIISHGTQNKKRYKTASAASSPDRHVQKKLNFEEFFLNLSKKLAFHQVFPQDEKEAAILLMALSCGLVHG